MYVTNNLSILICLSVLIIIVGFIFENYYVVGIGFTLCMAFFGIFIYFNKRRSNKKKEFYTNDSIRAMGENITGGSCNTDLINKINNDKNMDPNWCREGISYTNTPVSKEILTMLHPDKNLDCPQEVNMASNNVTQYCDKVFKERNEINRVEIPKKKSYSSIILNKFKKSNDKEPELLPSNIQSNNTNNIDDNNIDDNIDDNIWEQSIPTYIIDKKNETERKEREIRIQKYNAMTNDQLEQEYLRRVKNYDNSQYELELNNIISKRKLFDGDRVIPVKIAERKESNIFDNVIEGVSTAGYYVGYSLILPFYGLYTVAEFFADEIMSDESSSNYNNQKTGMFT